MDERLQFVARRLAGEAMVELCREFGISRKTGYKIFDRYQECGVEGLTDRSRRPYTLCQQTSLSGGELYSEREARAHQLGRSLQVRDQTHRRP
jgi:transposase-like protein